MRDNGERKRESLPRNAGLTPMKERRQEGELDCNARWDRFSQVSGDSSQRLPLKGPVSHSTRPVLVLLPFFVTGWGQPTRSWRDAACQQLRLSVHYATYIRRSERHILPATTLKHQWWTGHVSFRHLKKLVFKWEEMDRKQKCLNGNNKWVLLCK